MKRIEIIALFAAFSIFLSSIEYLLPRPLPFFRYGLANIAILLAIRHFNFRDLLTLAMLKVLGLGILNGTFASYVFIFSLFGTMGSFISMWLVVKILRTKVGLVGVSVIGALISNVIQISLAVLYVFGRQSWVIAPYLLVLGVGAGLVIGLFAQYYFMHSKILFQILKNYELSFDRVHSGKLKNE